MAAAARALAGVLAVTLSGAPFAIAAPTRLGPLTISVPGGFERYNTQRQGSLLMTAWTKSVPGESTKALLQVSIYDYGLQLSRATRQELGDGAEKYLLEFLGGIERRRTDYRLSKVLRFELAGAPAARASWTGRVGNIDAVGIMYCVIVQHRYVVSFHTQDLGSVPTKSMHEALTSIDAVKFAARP